MLCKQCLSGFSPRNVTGVMPLRCLFCDDTLQTWYIYQSLGKMRCTNCEAVKHVDKPLLSEECSKCGVYYEEGLLNTLTWPGVRIVSGCSWRVTNWRRVRQTKAATCTSVCFASKTLYGLTWDSLANVRVAKWWDQIQMSFHANAAALTFFLLLTKQAAKRSVLIAFEIFFV